QSVTSAGVGSRRICRANSSNRRSTDTGSLRDDPLTPRRNRHSRFRLRPLPPQARGEGEDAGSYFSSTDSLSLQAAPFTFTRYSDLPAVMYSVFLSEPARQQLLGSSGVCRKPIRLPLASKK